MTKNIGLGDSTRQRLITAQIIYSFQAIIDQMRESGITGNQILRSPHGYLIIDPL